MKTKMKSKTLSMLMSLAMVFAMLLGFAGLLGPGGLLPLGEAVYADGTYTVTVFDGQADRDTADEGDKVNITANAAPDGKAFCNWEANYDTVVFDDAGKWESSFFMIADPVQITARFADILASEIPDQVYTGDELRPAVSDVYLDGVDWKPEEGTDYTVSYRNNVNAGTATAVLTFIGDRPGKRTMTFTIGPADISTAEVILTDQVYTGQALKPVPTVIWNGKELTAGTDYTLTYSNNVNVGTAGVTLKGTGNFTGEIKDLTFRILPVPVPKVSGLPLAKMNAKGKTALTIGWIKTEGVAGYDIFFAECDHSGKKIVCKKLKTIKGNKTFTWTKSGLKKGTAYKAYVKAYVMENGKKKYIRTSPMIHAYTGCCTKNYTNAKSVTVNKARVSLKKGKTFNIEAKVNKLKEDKKLMPKNHAPTLRYLSSNKKIAAVSSSGKITAKGKGTCIIYVYAHNGVSKKINVTVK